MADERPATWEDLLAYHAKQAQVPLPLARAVMQQESGGKPDALGQPVKGQQAQGLFQLMPTAAAEMGVDPADPVQNIRGGVGYLRKQLDASQGDVGLALARYHGGPDLKQHGPKTAAYVQSILGRLQAPGGAGAAELGEKGGINEPAPAGGGRFISTVLASQIPPYVGQPPPKPPAPVNPPEPTFGERHPYLAAAASSFDPRTPEGRRNLAGGVGAAAGTAAVVGTAPVSLPVLGLTAGTAGVLGAIGGGMAAEAGEQLVGTAPPSSTEVLKAGAWQGAGEAAGYGVGRAVTGIGRRALARPTSKAAFEALSQAKRATAEQISGALDRATPFLETGKRGARQVHETVQSLIGAPPPRVPSAPAAGRAFTSVREGASQSALDALGKTVERTAETGPPLDIRPLKAEAQRILTEKIAPPATSFPRTAVDPEAAAEAAIQAAGFRPGTGTDAVSQAQRAILAETTARESLNEAQAAAAQELKKHPAFGVINRILNAPDEVPFVDAHLWKSELQNSLRGTYDKTVKSQVESLTQRLTGGLRQALAVHEPYNAANAAYASTVKLFSKGYAPKIRKLAVDAPEAVVHMVQEKYPTRAGMLHEILTTQAEAGGGAEAGQQALTAVQDAWMHEKLIRGGIEGLGQRVDNLSPEFKSAFLPERTATLERLKTVWTAFDHAQKRFAESSLAPKQLPTAEQAGSDIARAAILGPTSRWGGISWLRLLKGPKAADLIEWAAYTPQNTQAWIKAMTSPTPGLAVADLLRLVSEPAKQATGVGQPPPSPR